MNLSRVKAIILKDFYWAKGNSKLLGLTLMPVLMNVIFAKVVGPSAFGTGLSFSISFLGVFLTSFLLIEEKRKGTLRALLTTPLTNSELLLGKFIFTFSLCAFIAVFSVIINQRYDVLTNPLVILNIALFSAMACFIGFTQGLFFKSEQEMSIAAPIVMLLFVVGPAVEEATNTEVAAFFPDYHFTHALNSGEISVFESFFHSSFSIVLTIAAFIFAVTFARFYFSNNNEKRFSSKLSVIFSCFIGLFILSGLISPKIIQENLKRNSNDLSLLTFKTDNWTGTLKYNASQVEVKTEVNSISLQKYKFSKNNLAVIMQIRATRPNEHNEQSRENKIRSKKFTTVLAKEEFILSNYRFRKWVSIQPEGKVSVLLESICDQQLFQIFFDLEKKNLYKISNNMSFLEVLLSDLELNCNTNNSDQ